jgi:hypothetical protein
VAEGTQIREWNSQARATRLGQNAGAADPDSVLSFLFQYEIPIPAQDRLSFVAQAATEIAPAAAFVLSVFAQAPLREERSLGVVAAALVAVAVAIEAIEAAILVVAMKRAAQNSEVKLARCRYQCA